MTYIIRKYTLTEELRDINAFYSYYLGKGKLTTCRLTFDVAIWGETGSSVGRIFRWHNKGLMNITNIKCRESTRDGCERINFIFDISETEKYKTLKRFDEL